MEILIIRHGQSEADIIGVHEGRADFPLTKLGKWQAEKMTERVKDNFPPDIIWTSSLKRAFETAFILKTKINCPLRKEDNLMEWNNGVLAGLSRKEAEERYPMPAEGRAFHESIQNGESEIEFRMRAEAVFSKICYESKEYNRIAIVSHGGMISNLLKCFLKLPVDDQFAFATSDTGIHLLRITDRKRVVLFLNNNEHLLYS